MITISTHAPRMIPSEHLSRQRASMNGIFDHYPAVDQNGGVAFHRAIERLGAITQRCSGRKAVPWRVPHPVSTEPDTQRPVLNCIPSIKKHKHSRGIIGRGRATPTSEPHDTEA